MGALLTAAFFAGPLCGGRAEAGREASSVLELRIGVFKIENSDMEDALRQLRREDYSRILIGFERIARRKNEEEKQISLELRNPTVREVLDRLCGADPRYSYKVTDNVLINVFPQNGESDPHGLLNIRVSSFSVHGRYTAEGLIAQVSELAPELRSYLRNKMREHYADRGIMPGTAGSIVQGNMTPEFHLELRDVTVREILNAVVLSSFRPHVEAQSDSAGWKAPPASWKYEFIIDPDAGTGLGGVPRWEPFN